MNSRKRRQKPKEAPTATTEPPWGWGDQRAKPRPPEVRAKISATLKAKGIKPPPYSPPRVRPLDGTPERKLFNKIANECGLGSAAAHAELRRAANG